MSENVSDKTVFSLSQVMRSIQKTIQQRYASPFWVKAEMNKLNYYKHSGHCYPDLVEKEEGKIVAEMRAILWNTDYIRVNRKFETILKEPLRDGIKILFCARIQFDPKYGLSLLITDIDPSFTLGDLEKEKQETIAKLHSENLWKKNKLLSLPLLPQRIAVISVETSKGYADFLNVIGNNSFGYRFLHFLFPSLLQGEKAAESIMNQLRRIRKASPHFDVVAIVRGGGGEVGLACYNNYELAKAICEFPIPVITGIGHATNTTVSEMVAHTNAITPTKLAEFLIDKFHDFAVPLQRAEEVIRTVPGGLLSDKKNAFAALIRLFRSVSNNIFIHHGNLLRSSSRSISQQALFSLLQSREKVKNTKQFVQTYSSICLKQSSTVLDHLEKNIANLHPENVLKRGFSITRFNGKSVRDVKQLKEGDIIETITASGEIASEVSAVKPKN